MSSDIKLDPLYTIFEKHLYNFENEQDPMSFSEKDTAAFIDSIVKDYLNFLASQQVAVPLRWKSQILEELRDQVRKMLVKKTYGCLSVQEFMKSKPAPEVKQTKKKIKRKYRRLFG